MPQSLSKSFGQVPYSENLQETLKRVEAKARYSPDAIATLEHLLLSLLEDPDTLDVMVRCNVGVVQLDDISFCCGGGQNDPSTLPAEEIKFSEDLHRVLSKAATAAEQANRKQVDGAIVLAALVGDARCPMAQLLRKCGLTFDAVINGLKNKSDIQREQSETSLEPDPFASLRDEPESSDLSSILSEDSERVSEDSEPELEPIDWDELPPNIDFEEQDRKHSRPMGVGGGARERIGASEVGAASEKREQSETSVEPDPVASLRDEPRSGGMDCKMLPEDPERLLEDSEPELEPIERLILLMKSSDHKRSRPMGVGGGGQGNELAILSELVLLRLERRQREARI